MATDEKGYGSIYGSTWWGSGDAFTNTIGWGKCNVLHIRPCTIPKPSVSGWSGTRGF